MNLPSGPRLAALLLAGLPAACAAGDAASELASGDGADAGAGEVATPRVVAVDGEDPLVLLPGQRRFVGFSIRPPAALEARVALLGDYRDAFVGSSVVSTDASGQGSFTLAAPSTPAEFRLRIWVPGGAVEVDVVPGAGAISSLRVVPRYTGQRELGAWYASVGAGARCPAAGGRVPDDGPLVGVSAPSERPVVPGVPLGAPVTVLLRSERFAWGCLALPGGVTLPAAGAAEVEVTVTDVPLRLDSVSLELGLSFSPREGDLTDEGEVAAAVAGDLFGRGTEADALLAGLVALGGPALEARAARAGFGGLA
ncbi:MAG: hypothetical protein FJ104_13035, partial [Deltaproteobacteria bacterium]|nr:hypothetical protein [Deltaproteobacteria bacterium]